MRGFIEHDSRECRLGGHSNRGPVETMCPVYLELRRLRLRNIMRSNRYLEAHGDTADGRITALRIRLNQTPDPFGRSS
jgi:hypothetical protein